MASRADFDGHNSQTFAAKFFHAVTASGFDYAFHYLGEPAAGSVAGFASDAPADGGKSDRFFVAGRGDSIAPPFTVAHGMAGEAPLRYRVVALGIQAGQRLFLGPRPGSQRLPCLAVWTFLPGFIPPKMAHSAPFATDIAKLTSRCGCVGQPRRKGRRGFCRLPPSLVRTFLERHPRQQGRYQ